MVSLSPRAGGWLIGVLFVSLAANMFVGGVWIGHKFFHDRQYGDSDKRKFSMLSFAERMGKRLPPAEREKYMAVINSYRPEMGDAERQMDLARAKVREALSAVPFDPEALNQALAGVRESFADKHKVFHEALANAAAVLSPEARRDLARWDRNKHGRDGKGEDNGGDGD